MNMLFILLLSMIGRLIPEITWVWFLKATYWGINEFSSLFFLNFLTIFDDLSL